MDLVKLEILECWRCHTVLRGPGEVYQRHCPRCAHNLRIIDLEDISEAAERGSWQAAKDLGLLYTNWALGYVGLMKEKRAADYSLLDDLATDVMEQSLFYVQRLVDTGILLESGLSYIREILANAALLVLEEAEHWERCQVAWGDWNEKEAEIKDFWLSSLRKRGLSLPADAPGYDDRRELPAPHEEDSG